MGYIPLLVKLDLIQPIDESRVPNLANVMPIFRNDPNINRRRQALRRSLHLGRRPDGLRPRA